MGWGNRLAALAAVPLAASAIAMLGALGWAQRLDDEAAAAQLHAQRKEAVLADWLRAEHAALDALSAAPEPDRPRSDATLAAAELRQRLGALAVGSAERQTLDELDRRQRALQAERRVQSMAARLGQPELARLRFERELLPAAGALRQLAERFATDLRADAIQRAARREAERSQRAGWLYCAAAGQAALAALLLLARAFDADIARPTAARAPAAAGPRVQPADRPGVFDGNRWSLASARLRDADIVDVEARSADPAQPAARPDLRERA
ncbi:hypothetical protein [Derxia lacustris]|uniref:hypothetical protein n=1 Tax=Derxia lacustris TaxID=764842 RepID=UPI000A171EB1|nr:hypothetical protein [Derxia lacustris]